MLPDQSPVVPSVGAVPVEVTEDIVEAAAKAAADAVCPSSDYERWDRDAGEFVMQHDETGPDDAAFVSFLNTDGHRSVRGATYREVVAGAYPLIAARVRAEQDAVWAEAERAHEQAIRERDEAEEWADRLAAALAGDAVGEHSSANNPWQNALDIAADRDARVRAEERQQIEALLNEHAKTIDAFVRHGDSPTGFIAYLIGLGASGSAVPVATPPPPPVTCQPTAMVDLPGAIQDSINRFGPVATPTEPACSECGESRSDDPWSDEGISGMCLRCLNGPLPAEQDGQR